MIYPLVTIVIPSYNAQSFIGGCLESILCQTYQNLEIVVVDDGSVDETSKVVKSYSDPRLRLYELPNRGAGAARNSGFSEARGEFIQYLDADDLLHPNKLEEQIKATDRSSYDSTLYAATFWHFSASLQDAVERRLEIYHLPNPVDFLTCSWLGGGFIQTGGWLIPRKLHEKAGEWSEWPVNPNDDGEFFTRVLLKSKEIVYCKDAIFYYRLPRPDSLASQRSRIAAEALLWTLVSSATELLRCENTPRTVAACRANISRFVFEVLPSFPDLAVAAENFIKDAGGNALTNLDFDNSGMVGFVQKFLGWRRARFIQFRYRAMLTGGASRL